MSNIPRQNDVAYLQSLIVKLAKSGKAELFREDILFVDALRAREQVADGLVRLEKVRIELASELERKQQNSPKESSEVVAADSSTSIRDFDLSNRTTKALYAANIQTIIDLAVKTESELLALKNFGRKSLNEVKEILQIREMYAGMTREQAELAYQKWNESRM